MAATSAVADEAVSREEIAQPGSFAKLGEPRQSGKVMYPLPEIVLLVVSATIAGCDGNVEICAWGEDHPKPRPSRPRFSRCSSSALAMPARPSAARRSPVGWVSIFSPKARIDDGAAMPAGLQRGRPRRDAVSGSSRGRGCSRA